MEADMDGSKALSLADCAGCPLGKHHRKIGTWEPLAADMSSGARVLFVSPSPTKFEVESGVPFTGPLGVDLMRMLEGRGWTRDDASWTTAVACRWPKDKPKVFLNKLRKKNRDRVDAALPPHPTPAKCCRPRLEAEMDTVGTVVTFGGSALKAVGVMSAATGKINNNPGIDSVRGAPSLTASGKPLIATRDDWQRDPKWRAVVLEDIDRAIRLADGRLTWKDPEIISRPTLARLTEFLYSVNGPRLTAAVYDVETTESGHDPKGNRLFDARTDPLRCIGIGNEKEVVVIPFLGVDGETTFYTEEDEDEIKGLLRRWFIDRRVLKIGHNAGYYDEMVIENHLGVTPEPLLDTHPLCKLAEPEYPKGLGFQGSRFTDAPAWKSTHAATEAETDEELWLYNARDCAVNAAIVKPLIARAKRKKHYRFMSKYRWLQRQCVGMHKRGLRVDEEVRLRHEERLEQQSQRAYDSMRRIIRSDFNPNSYQQIQKVLYDDWGLPIMKVTSTGEPSTDDEIIRMLLANAIPDADQKAFLLCLRTFRGSEKALGTYIRKWSPSFGLVDSRGFLHPDYNAAGTVMWRYSSSNPNAQNVAYDLRDCFIAPEGMVFVGSDYDQLELRGAAGLAGATKYLDAFDDDRIDPHNMTGEMIFTKAYWDQTGAPSDPRGKGRGAFKRRRGLVKNFTYASIYGARPPTIHNILTQAEDDAGELQFLDLTLRFVRNMHSRWLREAPEFQRWWSATRKFWRRHGYVEEPLWGLRRYCVEDDVSELVNTPSQGLGGAVVHTGTKRIEENFSFGQDEGLCLQVHDSVVYCVAADAAEELRDVLDEHLTVVVPLGKQRRPVTFTADASIGKNLKEV